MTDVTQILSKTHLSVQQSAPQVATTDIPLYYTWVSRLGEYLPPKENQWHILIGKYVPETGFQKSTRQ